VGKKSGKEREKPGKMGNNKHLIFSNKKLILPTSRTE
jgi:hypothetical protein